MKIVCICDAGVPPALMEGMKDLPGCEVDIFEEESLMNIDAIMTALRAIEVGGPDAVKVSQGLLDAVQGADAIVCHVAPVGKEVLDAVPGLKYVGILRTGTENVDLELCKEKGIKVYNADGRNSVAVADMTVALMLCEMRNIARSHAALSQGKWLKSFSNANYSHDMNKVTVGVLGVGKIGVMVIDRLKGFGCKIIGCDIYLPPEEIIRRGCDEAVSKEELLAQADIITIHMRYEPGDPPLIGKEEMAAMKDTAILINCARSGLVDTQALADALKAGTIGGAAIDVFDEEPIRPDNPLIGLDNITLTPHSAGTTTDAFANSVTILAEQFKQLIETGDARNRIV